MKNENGKKVRNGTIDCLKGFCIWCVVLGHCIKNGSGDIMYNTPKMFYNDFLYRLIYSFHMPLFMLLSGFVFYYSHSKSFFTTVNSKVIRLLTPIVSWGILRGILFSIRNFDSILSCIKLIVNCIFNDLWFLWAILVSSFIVLIIERVFCSSYSKLVAYVLVNVFFLLTPDTYKFLGSGYCWKFVFPFFVIGYYVNKNLLFIKQNVIVRAQFIKYYCLNFIVFILLFSFFDYDKYIYISKYSITFSYNSLVVQFLIDIYRFLLGVSGSIFISVSVSLVLNFLKNNKIRCYSLIKKVLVTMGTESMEIYILSVLVFNIPLLKVGKHLFPSYFINIVEAFIIVIACIILSRIIKRLPFANLIFGCKLRDGSCTSTSNNHNND